jgi:CRP-like cAMP-binding protein
VRRTAAAASSGEERAVEVSLADARVLRPFARFDDEELSEVLSLMRAERVPAGACLFKEGDPCESCYIIVEGSIKVSVLAQGTQQKLTSLTASAVFGEMSLIERSLARRLASWAPKPSCSRSIEGAATSSSAGARRLLSSCSLR